MQGRVRWQLDPLKTLSIYLATIVLGGAALILNASAQSLPGWSLVWSDEFTQADGTSPDSTKWGNDIGGTGRGNN